MDFCRKLTNLCNIKKKYIVLEICSFKNSNLMSNQDKFSLWVSLTQSFGGILKLVSGHVEQLTPSSQM